MRIFPRNSSVSVQIFRSPSGGVEKYPTTPTYTVEGNLLQLYRRSHHQNADMMVVEYELYVPANVDLERSDEFVINGTTYYLKKILTMTMGIYPFILAYISTQA